jgi:dihydroorotase
MTDGTRAPKEARIKIRKPDDMHIHLRDGETLLSVAPFTAAMFRRAIIMPNLVPPVTTVLQALAYGERIGNAAKKEAFTPLLTMYLTENTSVEELKKAKDTGSIVGCKYYPAGATTNSESGIRSAENVFGLLEAMQKLGLVLLIHGEVADENVDPKDRETVFIDKHLTSLVARFPELKIVLEHVSTKEGVDFVTQSPKNVGATCTVHHMMFTDKDLVSPQKNPHLFCKPILKSEKDRKAVAMAATGGNPKFFAGTDSAPHPVSKKSGGSPAAGIFSAPVALPCYAQIFDSEGKWNGKELVNLENFLSKNGADFYGLPLNQETISLEKIVSTSPSEIRLTSDKIIPMLAGKEIEWSVVS